MTKVTLQPRDEALTESKATNKLHCLEGTFWKEVGTEDLHLLAQVSSGVFRLIDIESGNRTSDIYNNIKFLKMLDDEYVQYKGIITIDTENY